MVGASSGLGRCIGVGLAHGGAQVALLARRRERLEDASKEAGPGSVAIECDVTDTASCQSAIDEAAAALGGIDGIVYTPAIGPLARLVDTDAAQWRRVFDTNVIGASLVTTAALRHLVASAGTAVYLSSVSASQTPPWPGLGAYAVSKAALDKLVDAWRAEHPDVGFTRLIVGECGGGEGDAGTGFADGWDLELAAELVPLWIARAYMTGALMPVERLVNVVEMVLQAGAAGLHPVGHRGAPGPGRIALAPRQDSTHGSHGLWLRAAPRTTGSTSSCAATASRLAPVGSSSPPASAAPLVDEQDHGLVVYFPREDVRLDELEPSEHTTRCPYKGSASHWQLPGSTQVVAWTYEDPYPQVAQLAGSVAFYQDRVIVSVGVATPAVSGR